MRQRYHYFTVMRALLRIAPTLLFLACGTQPVGGPIPTGFTLPDGVTLVDAGSGRPVPSATLMQRIGDADFVLLGEVHDNAAQHRVRGELITAFAAKHPGIAFEQFAASDSAIPRPAAGAPLDGWLDQHGFDRKAWRWPLHQPVVDAAIANGRSLWGSGVSRDELRAIVRGGEAATPAPLRSILAAAPLDSAGTASIDQELMDSHCGKLPASMVPGMRAAQITRDAAMTRALMLASAGGPAWLIAGNGHVRRDMGVPRLLVKAAPGKKVLVVGLLERASDGSAPSAESRKPYDLVLVTPRAEREDPCAGM
jgi:uncharacterized iron-regulated protein